MWPFSSVDSLKSSGLFEGFVDYHSHILPGVDDGVQELKTAIEVLTQYEKLGIERVWLTPHIMEDIPNHPSKLRETYQKLCDSWMGNVKLSLAAEHMLDNLFAQRLEENDVLPIGDDGNHLLVETSYYTPPIGMEDTLSSILRKGYFPILAHPERYRYMEEKDYKALKDMGVLFQMNIISLVGAYGETAKKKAEWLLAHDMIDIVGSDLHRLDNFLTHIEKSPKKKGTLMALLEIAKNPKIRI